MIGGIWIPILGIIAGIAFIAAFPVTAALLLAQKTNQAKHAERMAMIEKGVLLEEPEKKANKYSALRNGLLMIGLALGAIAGLSINRYFFIWEGGFLVFILALLGGGIAFVIYFFIARKMQREEGRDADRM
jgi:ABC-type Fe3+-siderophore transport system permease subunit